jgi:putative FmdB family regulatory protein
MIKVRDFHCKACGLTWEKFTKDGVTQECPHCGSGDVVQVATGAAFKVNGQGAYDRKMKV